MKRARNPKDRMLDPQCGNFRCQNPLVKPFQEGVTNSASPFNALAKNIQPVRVSSRRYDYQNYTVNLLCHTYLEGG